MQLKCSVEDVSFLLSQTALQPPPSPPTAATDTSRICFRTPKSNHRILHTQTDTYDLSTDNMPGAMSREERNLEINGTQALRGGLVPTTAALPTYQWRGGARYAIDGGNAQAYALESRYEQAGEAFYWVVDRIIDQRTNNNGGVEYRALWGAPYTPADASWEPAAHFHPTTIAAYLRVQQGADDSDSDDSDSDDSDYSHDSSSDDSNSDDSSSDNEDENDEDQDEDSAMQDGGHDVDTDVDMQDVEEVFIEDDEDEAPASSRSEDQNVVEVEASSSIMTDAEYQAAFEYARPSAGPPDPDITFDVDIFNR
ncbi:hypothetical protein LTR36_008820 [Oleoguttula mirabilis]|uniref:Chromo domain-containing protein n=1 Tax=Oleoguttula mirabilis TaxID=1507867 RepID=A0AAV9J804_9PEZI|nr:hypothetical protein LTR36_008820 [Oleoguttula mirabilis]